MTTEEMKDLIYHTCHNHRCIRCKNSWQNWETESEFVTCHHTCGQCEAIYSKFTFKEDLEEGYTDKDACYTVIDRLTDEQIKYIIKEIGRGHLTKLPAYIIRSIYAEAARRQL